MRRKIFPVVIFFSCVVMIISFCSWGFYVHETTTQLAVYELPKHLRQFFFSNIDSLTSNSIRPDKRRYTDKGENRKHFIDIEAYGENAINDARYMARCFKEIFIGYTEKIRLRALPGFD
jgi:hypothetical protein